MILNFSFIILTSPADLNNPFRIQRSPVSDVICISKFYDFLSISNIMEGASETRAVQRNTV